MQDNITANVRSFVVGNFLFGQNRALADDASFLEEGIIDSTGILELVSYLEEHCEIEITEEELVPENLDSINRISAYLARKLNGRAQEVPVAAPQISA
jgi:acyl carrier protein